MEFNKKLFYILIVFSLIFYILGQFSIVFTIIGFLMLLSTLVLPLLPLFKVMKELKNPSHEHPPLFLKNAVNKKNRIYCWIYGIFLLFVGILNLKLRFLRGRFSDTLFPLSFQYPFSVVLILLGLLFIFLALMKYSERFSGFVMRRYPVFALILFVFFALFIIVLFFSMVFPVFISGF